MIQHTGSPDWLAYLVAIAFGGVAHLALRRSSSARLCPTRPAGEDDGHARRSRSSCSGSWRGARRSTPRPSASSRSRARLDASRSSASSVTGTQIIAIALAVAITAGITVFLRFTQLGTAMRALANDREISATLGVPVRKVEAAAWFGSGIICGAAGLLLADLLQTLDYSGAHLPRHLRARRGPDRWLNSLWGTLARWARDRDRAGRAEPVLHRSPPYRRVAPFAIAILALLWFGRRRVVVISRTARVSESLEPGGTDHSRGRRHACGRLLVRRAVRRAPSRRRRLDETFGEHRDLLRRGGRASASSTGGSG